MTEERGDAGSGSGAFASAVGWALAGTGGAMALSRWWFTSFADVRWLVPSGAILVVGGVALGFYSHVQSGGLERGADAGADDGAGQNAAPTARFLTPLAGVVTLSFVLAIAAALHSRAPVGTGAARGQTQTTVNLPGITLSLPPTRNVQENQRLARLTAELIGPPSGRLAIEWRASEVEADEATLRRAAESMSGTWGDLQRSYDYEGPGARGAVFSYQKNKRHTALALVRCLEHPLSLSITVTTARESDAVAAARAITDGARCTGDAPTQTATDIWPSFSLGERFGLIELNESARMFASLDGEALVFHRHSIEAVKTLQREQRALQMSLSGGGKIENWTAASWPIGHRTQQPLWSFDMVEEATAGKEVRKQAYATTLLCQEPGVGFVVLALADDRGENLARLLSVSCPRSDEPAARYKTIEQVAKELCDEGDAAACEALGKAP